MIMRTCHGIGDWGIISAMPRLLKEKYPNCKVYLPSVKLLENLFGKQQSSSWSNPFENVKNVFKNNPYVDGFKDYYVGEIFHDQYRVYDKNDPNICNTRKDKSIIVCCYHGNSSQSAAEFLVKSGFNDVYSLDGGYEAWRIRNNNK